MNAQPIRRAKDTAPASHLLRYTSMNHNATTQVIATRVRGCLVVTLPADLLPEVIDAARQAILEGLSHRGAQFVALELSAVQLMDLEDFEALRDITTMSRLMGARPMWVGLRPGIVLHLIDSNIDTKDVEGVRDLEEALNLAEAHARRMAEVESGEEAPEDLAERSGIREE